MLSKSRASDFYNDERFRNEIRPNTSYVLIRPNTTQSGSGHAYLSARKCNSRNKNKILSQFQHNSTLCYKLTLAKRPPDDLAYKIDGLSILKKDILSHNSGSKKCDQVTIKRTRKKENVTDRIYISRENKKILASETIKFASDNENDLNENIDGIDEFLKEVKGMKNNKPLFKRRYVLSAGKNRNKVEEFLIGNTKNSETHNTKQNDLIQSKNLKLENLISKNTWQELKENEQNKIFQTLHLLSDENDNKNEIYNSINFFYTVRQKTDLSIEKDSIVVPKTSIFPLKQLNEKITTSSEKKNVNEKNINIESINKNIEKQNICFDNQTEKSYTEENNMKISSKSKVKTADSIKSSSTVFTNDDSFVNIKNAASYACTKKLQKLSSRKSRRSSLSSTKKRSDTPSKKNKG